MSEPTAPGTREEDPLRLALVGRGQPADGSDQQTREAALSLLDERLVRHFACDCVERALPFSEGTSASAVVSVARDFAEGRATREELREAAQARAAADTVEMAASMTVEAEDLALVAMDASALAAEAIARQTRGRHATWRETLVDLLNFRPSWRRPYVAETEWQRARLAEYLRGETEWQK